MWITAVVLHPGPLKHKAVNPQMGWSGDYIHSYTNMRKFDLSYIISFLYEPPTFPVAVHLLLDGGCHAGHQDVVQCGVAGWCEVAKRVHQRGLLGKPFPNGGCPFHQERPCRKHFCCKLLLLLELSFLFIYICESSLRYIKSEFSEGTSPKKNIYYHQNYFLEMLQTCLPCSPDDGVHLNELN